MEILKQRRLQLNMKLTELALLTRIPRQTLSDFETGRYLPSPEMARRLGIALNLPGIPDNSQVLTDKDIRALARPRSLDLKVNNQNAWQALEAKYGHLLKRLNIKPDLVDWMKICLPSQSVTECITLCCVGADDARGMFGNPHSCGFRSKPILDREGFPLGERLLPGLLWNLDGKPVSLWPQVWVQTVGGPFCLDLLVLHQNHWLNVEADGPYHGPAHDAYRKKCIGLNDARIPWTDVRELRFLDFLAAELRKNLRQAA